jgi:hypothetical protein
VSLLLTAGPEIKSEQPLYVKGVAISQALGLRRETVAVWCAQGRFPGAIRTRRSLLLDEIPRKTQGYGGTWLVPMASVRAWLRSAPKAVLRSIERRAAELSPDARIVQGPGAQPLPTESPKPVVYQKIQCRALR